MGNSAKETRGLDRYLVVWGIAFIATSVIVIIGNLLLSPLVGIVSGCLLGIIGLLGFVNSSRYVRDAWELEQQIAKTLDKQSRDQLALSVRRKRDLREVDVNHALIYLSGSAVVFALTMLLMMYE